MLFRSARHDIPFDEDLLLAAHPTRQGGYEAMNALLDKQPKATAMGLAWVGRLVKSTPASNGAVRSDAIIRGG